MTNQTNQPERKVPYSEDAELAVLSAILMDAGETKAFAKARAVITASAFHLPENRRIFAAMERLFQGERMIDPLTVKHELLASQELEAIGGEAYLGYLLDAVPTTANVEYHAAIIWDHAAQRQLIDRLTAAAEKAWSPRTDPAKLAQDLISAFLPIASPDLASKGYQDARELFYPLLEEIESRQHSGGISGVATGYPEIDNHAGGFRPGEVVGICGLPNAGKSIVMTNFAANNLHAGVAVGVISAEMGARAVIERMLVRDAGLSATAIRKGDVGSDGMRLLAKAASRLAPRDVVDEKTKQMIRRGVGLFIDDTPGPELREIVARAHALKVRHPDVGILYVDYLQLVNDANETRAEELRGVCRGFQTLAKQLQIPIVILAQLNDRSIETRPDHRPRESDVQGSSGLRQVVDFLALIHRPSMWPEWNGTLDTLELTFAKTRNVGKFTAVLEADTAHMRLRSGHDPEPAVKPPRQLEFT